MFNPTVTHNITIIPNIIIKPPAFSTDQTANLVPIFLLITWLVIFQSNSLSDLLRRAVRNTISLPFLLINDVISAVGDLSTSRIVCGIAGALIGSLRAVKDFWLDNRLTVLLNMVCAALWVVHNVNRVNSFVIQGARALCDRATVIVPLLLTSSMEVLRSSRSACDEWSTSISARFEELSSIMTTIRQSFSGSTRKVLQSSHALYINRTIWSCIHSIQAFLAAADHWLVEISLVDFFIVFNVLLQLVCVSIMETWYADRSSLNAWTTLSYCHFADRLYSHVGRLDWKFAEHNAILGHMLVPASAMKSTLAPILKARKLAHCMLLDWITWIYVWLMHALLPFLGSTDDERALAGSLPAENEAEDDETDEAAEDESRYSDETASVVLTPESGLTDNNEVEEEGMEGKDSEEGGAE